MEERLYRLLVIFLLTVTVPYLPLVSPFRNSRGVDMYQCSVILYLSIKA